MTTDRHSLSPPPFARFRIATLGCKVNQYESAALAGALARSGLSRAPGRSDGPVELLVVNTCCVTAPAMAKSHQAIARAVRSAPGAAVLVAGCYGDYDARRIGQLLARLGVPPDKAVIAGHHDDLSTRILQVSALVARPGRGRASVGLLRREQPMSGGAGGASFTSAATSSIPTSTPTSIRARRQAAVKHIFTEPAGLPPLREFPGRQRAIVKIQDGCDAFCSYCIVPYIRCRMHSRPPDQVEQECRDLVAAGHREIVLCGVFLGAYGRATAVRSRWGGRAGELPGLVRRLAAIEGLWRLRLSSLECLDVTGELLAVCRDTPTVAPHFHLPLQSGSDRILRRMNRRYTAGQFLDTVGRLREALDRPAVTTDILVGFPGEADDDFTETLAVARAAGFAKIHAFPFSPIRPTAGWAMRREAPSAAVVKRRMGQLAAVEAELAGAYRGQFVGQRLEAIVENLVGGDGGHWVGRTDRYFTVTGTDPAVRPGDVVRVTVEHPEGGQLAGRVHDILWRNPNLEAPIPKQTAIQQIRMSLA